MEDGAKKALVAQKQVARLESLLQVDERAPKRVSEWLGSEVVLGQGFLRASFVEQLKPLR